MHDPDPLAELLAPSARCLLAELQRRDAAAAPNPAARPRPWLSLHAAELAAACGLTYYTAIHALAALRDVGAVETHRHGRDGLTFRLTGEALDAPTPPGAR